MENRVVGGQQECRPDRTSSSETNWCLYVNYVTFFHFILISTISVFVPSSALNHFCVVLFLCRFYFSPNVLILSPSSSIPSISFTLCQADDHSDSHSSHGYGQMDSNSTHGAGHGTGLGVGYSPTPSSPLPLPLSGFGPTVAGSIPRVKSEVNHKN